MDLKTFVFGTAVGLSFGFLLWTETGKMLTGATKETVKSELRQRLAALESPAWGRKY